jgi:hypothetical protein
MECIDCFWYKWCQELGVSLGDSGTSYNCNPVPKNYNREEVSNA